MTETKLPADVQQILVDQDDNIVALGKSRKGDRILHIDTSGTVRRDMPLQRAIERIAVAGGGFVGWTDNQIILRPGDAEQIIANTVPSTKFAAILPEGRLAIITAESPVLSVFDTSGNLLRSVPLETFGGA